ncbi:ABC transporter permease [Roseomonas sp. NAR14]|uniref:ABC transporter permease n=1 Tax=Roseomonas acroporae TaxID=2937791 RepID=A0A9X2BYL8_9PROT|nr:ABC transporter permease [Roseomonas acroporae]MCK8787064.1 ABC transporter permease [Roseomonas acroporae]
MRSRALVPWLWLLPAGCLLVPFFVLPLAVTFRNSFWRDDDSGVAVPAFTFANYARVLGDPYYLQVFGNTLWIALLIAALALAIAFPFAWLLARLTGRAQALVFWVVYLPLYVSVVMRAFGWIVILADSGVVNQALLAMGLIRQPIRILFEVEGMVIGMLHRYLPLMIVPLVTALRKLDPSLLRASANLGAGHWYTWRRVVVPAALPGIVAGTQLVFSGVLSDYVTPSLMGASGYQLVAPAIYYEAATNSAWALAGAMATLTLALVSLLLVVANALLRRFAPWAATL